MDTMRIDVVVPSGWSTSVSISAEAHVRDLQEAAQKDLKLGPLSCLAEDLFVDVVQHQHVSFTL